MKRIIQVFLIIMLAVIFASTSMMSAMDNSTEHQEVVTEKGADASKKSTGAPKEIIKLTVDHVTFVELVPDISFRSAIVSALQADQHDVLRDNSKQAVEDLLQTYAGTIDASGQGISDIHGVEYLRKVRSIDFSNNFISDWTPITPEGLTKEELNNYYGCSGPDFYNTEFIIANNPFKNLPANFGGRLVIPHLADVLSVYPDKDIQQSKFFIREQGMQSFDTMIDIGIAHLAGTSEGNDHVKDGFVKLVAAYFQSEHHPITDFDSLGIPLGDFTTKNAPLPRSDAEVNNQYVKLHNIRLNEDEKFSFSTEQVMLFYQVAQGGELSPNSNSFKYTIAPTMTIYDRVHLATHSNGSVMITKVDAETKEPLEGAQYSLFRDGKEMQTGLLTNDAGIILVEKLEPGTYYFKETQAPAGYELDETPIHFIIKEPAVTIAGGYQDVVITGTDGTTAIGKAADHETLIAGNTSQVKTPDIILTTNEEATPKNIKVAYAGVAHRENGDLEIEAEVREFTTLLEAQRDINEMKNANLIAGPVTIEVSFDAPVIALTHADKAVPVTPEIPEVPSEPEDPVTPIVPVEENVVKEKGDKPFTGDTSSMIFLATLCALTISFIIVLLVMKNQQHPKYLHR